MSGVHCSNAGVVLLAISFRHLGLIVAFVKGALKRQTQQKRDHRNGDQAAHQSPHNVFNVWLPIWGFIEIK